MGKYGRKAFRDEDFDVDTPYTVQRPHYSSESSTATKEEKPGLMEKFTSNLPYLGKMKKTATSERQLPRAPERLGSKSTLLHSSPLFVRETSKSSLSREPHGIEEIRKAEVLEGLAFNSLLSNAGETLNPLRGEVAQMREQVQRLRDELTTMKNGRGHHKSLAQVCDCGDKFLEDALFCRKCGAKRAEVYEAICGDCLNTGIDFAGKPCSSCSSRANRPALHRQNMRELTCEPKVLPGAGLGKGQKDITANGKDHFLHQFQTLPVDGHSIADAISAPLKHQDKGILADLWSMLGCGTVSEAIEQAQGQNWSHQTQPMQMPGAYTTAATVGRKTWDEQRVNGGAFRELQHDIRDEGCSNHAPSSASTWHLEPEEEDSPKQRPKTMANLVETNRQAPPVETVWQFGKAEAASAAPVPRSPSIASIDAPSTSSTPWRYCHDTGSHYQLPFPELSDEFDDEGAAPAAP